MFFVLDQEFLLFELIKSGAVVNATNYHGSTPLHLACLRGHKKPAVCSLHILSCYLDIVISVLFNV